MVKHLESLSRRTNAAATAAGRAVPFLWSVFSNAVDRIPGTRRFNNWANGLMDDRFGGRRRRVADLLATADLLAEVPELATSAALLSDTAARVAAGRGASRG